MNQFRHFPPPGWSDTSTAPRDGTVIEIQNNWGVAPWYRLAKWDEHRGWVDARDPDSSCTDGRHVSWRPYRGAVESYVDPTGGAQDTEAYWRRAVDNKYLSPPKSSEQTPAAKDLVSSRLVFFALGAWAAVAALAVGFFIERTL